MAPEVRSKHVFTLVLIFWLAWLYTEVSEKLERDAFQNEVDEFMHKGGRFTHDDGAKLERRITEIEERINE